MPQAQLPMFPAGTTLITSEVGFECRNGQVVYFSGHLPILTHEEDDIAAFRFITSQLIVNGTITQAQIVKAFGVSLTTVKRCVKRYREGGAQALFKSAAKRKGPKLTANVFGNCDNLGENLTALGADTVGAATPFVTGGGAAVRAGSKASDLVGAARGGSEVHSIYKDGLKVYEGQQPPRITGPQTDAPHTVLRWDNVNNRVYQGREYNAAGNPIRDVDFTNPTFPNGTPRPGHPGPPHQHPWVVNDPNVGPRSGFQRGGPQPLP